MAVGTERLNLQMDDLVMAWWYATKWFFYKRFSITLHQFIIVYFYVKGVNSHPLNNPDRRHTKLKASNWNNNIYQSLKSACPCAMSLNWCPYQLNWRLFFCCRTLCKAGAAAYYLANLISRLPFRFFTFIHQCWLWFRGYFVSDDFLKGRPLYIPLFRRKFSRCWTKFFFDLSEQSKRLQAGKACLAFRP